MSKYGYTGGVKRPVDNSMKGDPEGPSIEELKRYFKANALKDPNLAAKLDPRAGGPAFRKQVVVPKRTFMHRNPVLYRNLIFGTFVLFTFVGPIVYKLQQPLDPGNAEYNEHMKKAWNEKFKDTWYIPRWK